MDYRKVKTKKVGCDGEIYWYESSTLGKKWGLMELYPVQVNPPLSIDLEGNSLVFGPTVDEKRLLDKTTAKYLGESYVDQRKAFMEFQLEEYVYPSGGS